MGNICLFKTNTGWPELDLRGSTVTVRWSGVDTTDYYVQLFCNDREFGGPVLVKKRQHLRRLKPGKLYHFKIWRSGFNCCPCHVKTSGKISTENSLHLHYFVTTKGCDIIACFALDSLNAATEMKENLIKKGFSTETGVINTVSLCYKERYQVKLRFTGTMDDEQSDAVISPNAQHINSHNLFEDGSCKVSFVIETLDTQHCLVLCIGDMDEAQEEYPFTWNCTSNIEPSINGSRYGSLRRRSTYRRNCYSVETGYSSVASLGTLSRFYAPDMESIPDLERIPDVEGELVVKCHVLCKPGNIVAMHTIGAVQDEITTHLQQGYTEVLSSPLKLTIDGSKNVQASVLSPNVAVSTLSREIDITQLRFGRFVQLAFEYTTSQNDGKDATYELRQANLTWSCSFKVPTHLKLKETNAEKLKKSEVPIDMYNWPENGNSSASDTSLLSKEPCKDRDQEFEIQIDLLEKPGYIAAIHSNPKNPDGLKKALDCFRGYRKVKTLNHAVLKSKDFQVTLDSTSSVNIQPYSLWIDPKKLWDGGVKPSQFECTGKPCLLKMHYRLQQPGQEPFSHYFEIDHRRNSKGKQNAAFENKKNPDTSCDSGGNLAGTAESTEATCFNIQSLNGGLRLDNNKIEVKANHSTKERDATKSTESEV